VSETANGSTIADHWRLQKGRSRKAKAKINDLERRASELHEDWIAIFGQDTPVPIDRAYHNLIFAMQDIQTADRCDPRIEMAREQLDQAKWILNFEQSESNSKPF